MQGKIKAFIVNRNLLSTFRNTVEFLLKESRVEVVVFDQQSTYAPLLDYYQKENLHIVYANSNDGPHSVWGGKLNNEFNDNYFIVTDPDCLYDGIPEDWLDNMLNVLDKTSAFKVGFSLDIFDLPQTDISKKVVEHEKKFWTKRVDFGWDASIDTTFALYRPRSHFYYDAVRLDKPYCIRHMPWYITQETITDEWKYYLENASGVSCWGSEIKANFGIAKK